MNSIRIGADEREISQADSQWITQEVVGRRKDGLPICIVVTVKANEVDLRLVSVACGGTGGGGGRTPTAREAQILDLWRKHHLGEQTFSPGDVVSFVKQLQRLLYS